MKLSIIIPVFNEDKSIEQILDKLAATKINRVTTEFVVVDDGSTDKTADILKNYKKNKKITNILFFRHTINQGKGSAIKTGAEHTTGDYILIQDADLEYDPADINRLVLPILEKKAPVVYGTRLSRMPNLKKDEKTFRFFIHYLGNKILSLITSVLYGQWITDMETCYKIFPKAALSKIQIQARGFDFEPEITAKLRKNGYKIYEVPIRTTPRGYDEGKKLQTIPEGIRAFWALIKYRFVDA